MKSIGKSVLRTFGGLAVATLLALPWVRQWRVDDPVLFVVLSAFVLAGELLPIPVPRRLSCVKPRLS